MWTFTQESYVEELKTLRKYDLSNCTVQEAIDRLKEVKLDLSGFEDDICIGVLLTPNKVRIGLKAVPNVIFSITWDAGCYCENFFLPSALGKHKLSSEQFEFCAISANTDNFLTKIRGWHDKPDIISDIWDFILRS